MTQLLLAGLPPQLRRVTDLAIHGASNKEIATAMDLSEGTVKVYMSHATHRMRAQSRFDLMGRYIQDLEQQLRDLSGAAAGAD